jgi:hypothetical protein
VHTVFAAGPCRPATYAPVPAPASTPLRAVGMDGLRRLHVPSHLIDTFLLIAEENTLRPPRGIETCGILAGGLTKAGELEVTTLVIPKQVCVCTQRWLLGAIWPAPPPPSSLTRTQPLIPFCVMPTLGCCGLKRMCKAPTPFPYPCADGRPRQLHHAVGGGAV